MGHNRPHATSIYFQLSVLNNEQMKHTLPWDVGVSPEDVIRSNSNNADSRSLAIAFAVKRWRAPGINRRSVTPCPVTPVNTLQVGIEPFI